MERLMLWLMLLAATPAYSQELAPLHPQREFCAFYQWTQPNEHHKAAVFVSTGKQAGSGVYVQHGNSVAIMTAEHVVEGARALTIRWHDGKTTTATKWTRDKFGHDVAMIVASRADVTPIPMATRPPKPSERLEVMGFGGPESRLRHYHVMYGGAPFVQDAIADPGPISGDSGGAILVFNPGPQVVSIVSGGMGVPLGKHDKFTVHRTLVFAKPTSVRAFANRVVQTHPTQYSCPPGGSCGPGNCYPPPGPSAPPGASPLYPPKQPSPGGGSDPFRGYRPVLAEIVLGYSRAREASLLNRLDRVHARQDWLTSKTDWRR